jgi:restriction system protein
MSELIDELPKHDELFWPVVRAFRQLDGSADNEQLVEKVSELLEIDDELTAIPHKAGPQTEISYRIAWVKSWLKWGGIVDNPRRAMWVLTESGRGATEEEVNAVRQRRRAEAARKRKAKLSRAEAAEADDLDAAPSSEELDQFADDGWQNELLDIIREMPSQAFERLARQLLLSLGFSHVEVVGKSGDGGIDLLGVVKINDVLTFRVLAQCKRYKGTVAPKDIRDFRGAMQGRTDKGIYITSGRYSRDARKEASRDGVPEIDLVDGEGLANLLKRLEMGVETKLVEKVIVHKDFFSKI